ncbi:MAG: efflux RND transporter periplasmic adaptor subunit [Deltaproteobacteria bacterium]|jgi:membrane fusion protein (multidrug efflux system)|nr:efflux RND transporter periplasmic adaptor subunit [Deltaproteobacteria bacterium]
MVRYLKLLGVLTLPLLFLGCSGAEPAAPPSGPPAVTVLTLKPEDLVVTQEYVGFVEGRQVVKVRAQVDGLLLSKDYQEGEWVEAGQVLFRIEDNRYRSQVNQATARLSGAKNVLDHADRDLERARKLRERDAIALRDLNEAETQRANALAGFHEAEAALEEAAVRLAMTEVRAPVGGYAGMAEQMPGSLITSASEVGGLLTTIYDMSEIKVIFAVPETQVRQISRLSKEEGAQMKSVLEAALLMDFGETYPHRGRMEYGNAAADRATGTMLARAVFSNPDRQLYNGQIVRVKLDLLTLADVLSVPQTAVNLNGGQQSLALLDEEDRVVFEPLKAVGPINGRFLVRPGGPVKSGARVIVEGVNKVGPGLKVKVSEKSETAGTAESSSTPAAAAEPAKGDLKP